MTDDCFGRNRAIKLLTGKVIFCPFYPGRLEYVVSFLDPIPDNYTKKTEIEYLKIAEVDIMFIGHDN